MLLLIIWVIFSKWFKIFLKQFLFQSILNICYIKTKSQIWFFRSKSINEIRDLTSIRYCYAFEMGIIYQNDNVRWINFYLPILGIVQKNKTILNIKYVVRSLCFIIVFFCKFVLTFLRQWEIFISLNFNPQIPNSLPNFGIKFSFYNVTCLRKS